MPRPTSAPAGKNNASAAGAGLSVGDLIIAKGYAEARARFWKFRKLIDPALIDGWWHYEASLEFERFYHAMKAGLRPVLALEAPPQHGKSRLVRDFLAWLAGKEPSWPSVYCSYSDELSKRMNSEFQTALVSHAFRNCFPATRISERGQASTAQHYFRNLGNIQYIGQKGGFRNTTINGQITGFGFRFGAIDDPIKNRKEANSPTIRNDTWNWLTDDFFTRLADNAGVIMIMTRWHVDDPLGRIREKFPNAKFLKFKAIATDDEAYRDKGEPLFPEFKSLAFLNERRRLMLAASFESIYQQSPYVTGGGMFPIGSFKLLTALDRRQVTSSVRYWDKAGTEGGGKYTCGVLMHQMRDGTFVVEDVRRGQWSALKREQMIKDTARIDKTTYPFHKIWVEQEPGSGGKESAEATIRMLASFSVFADKVTGDKETRAEPYAAQVEGGNVYLLTRPWVRSFLEEHEHFPSGKYVDQVDSAAGAFAKLSGPSYDASLSWVGV